MANQKFINTFSLVVAILAYIVAVLFVVRITQDDIKDIKRFGYDKEKAIEVNLNDILLNKNINTKKSSPEKPKIKPKIIKISSNKDKKSTSDSRDVVKRDIKDLFSTMRVKKDANEIEEKLKQQKARASRLKKIDAKELFKSSAFDTKKIQNELLKIKKVLKDKTDKVKGEYDDKYFAKISSILMSRWQNTISTRDGLKATVMIKIDKRGRLFYRNLKKTFNNLFDSKLKEFLDNLTKEKFPPYKKGNFIEAEFIFADKEEI